MSLSQKAFRLLFGMALMSFFGSFKKSSAGIFKRKGSALDYSFWTALVMSNVPKT